MHAVLDDAAVVDARDILEDLQQRFAAVRERPGVTLNDVLVEFVAFAEVPATYAGGAVEFMDTVTLYVSVYDSEAVASAAKRGQTCEIGDVEISFGRDLNVENEDGEFMEHVGVGIGVVLNAPGDASLESIGPIVAPSGRHAADATYDEFTESGDGVTTAATLTDFTETVRSTLPLGSPVTVAWVDGNAAGDYDE